MILIHQGAAPDEPQPAQRVLTTRRKLLFTGIMVLIVLVAIELGLSMFYQPIRPESVDQKLARIPEYARLDWPRELFTEELQVRAEFTPWIMYRRKEFHGKYINVSPEGLRKTWNPPFTKDQKVKKVFCFGGSTTWGIGSRDDFTIPSLLSKKLNQGLDRFVVVNHGQQTFNFKQEVINLVLLLMQGDIPDYVIFYDGVNEAMVGHTTGQAGSFFRASDIKNALYKESSFWPRLRRTLLDTSIYNAGREMVALVRLQFNGARSLSPSELAKINQLAEDLVDDYLKDVKFVERLSESFGFKCLFIWQPVLFTTKAITSDEKNEPAWKDKAWVKTTESVYERMDKVNMDHFYNISNIFDQKNRTLFFSWAHITEEGNEQVAQRIYQIFQQEFGPTSSAGTESSQTVH
jgi:lysophospholipase L1-like esterase